jgi:UDP-glucose 6-dehydrogenase
MNRDPEIAIGGMGYPGLTLGATLADLGFKAFRYEHEPEVVHRLNKVASILKANLRPVIRQN